MINLKKQEENGQLQEYMLALDDPRKKEVIDLGNDLFPNSKKRELETQMGELIEKQKIAATLESLKGKYKTVFSANEIKQECIKYNLEFSTASAFEGDFDYEYIEKIQKFINDNELVMSKNDIKYNFCILTSSSNKKNPLIFYRHDERGAFYYVMIDGDKDYINPLNYFLGVRNKSKNSLILTDLFVTLLVLNVIAVFIFLFAHMPLDLTGSLCVFAVTLLISFFTTMPRVESLKEYEFNYYKYNELGHLLNQKR